MTAKVAAVAVPDTAPSSAQKKPSASPNRDTFTLDLESAAEEWFDMPMGSFAEEGSGAMTEDLRGSPRTRKPVNGRAKKSSSETPQRLRIGAIRSPALKQNSRGAPHPYHSYMYPHYYGHGSQAPHPPPNAYRHRGSVPGAFAPPPWPAAETRQTETATHGKRILVPSNTVATPVKGVDAVFRKSPGSTARKRSPVLSNSFSFPGPLDSFTMDTPGRQLGESIVDRQLGDTPGRHLGDFSPLAGVLGDPLSKHHSAKEGSPFSGFFASATKTSPNSLTKSRRPSPMIKSSRDGRNLEKYFAGSSISPPEKKIASTSSIDSKSSSGGLRASPLISSQGTSSTNSSDPRPRRLWNGQEGQKVMPSTRIELLGGHGTSRSLAQINSRMRIKRSSSIECLSKNSASNTGSDKSESRAKIAVSVTPRDPSPTSVGSSQSIMLAPDSAIRSSPLGSQHRPYGAHHLKSFHHSAIPQHTPLKPGMKHHHNFPSASPAVRSGHMPFYSGGSLVSPMPKVPSSVSKDSGKKQPAPCKCKKSRCLKLYCDCFGASSFCNGACKCLDCHNTIEFEEIRNKAIKEIKSKNANAFKPRVVNAPEKAGQGAHNMGCKCSKTGCLKKYCECFKGGVMCGDKCKCQGCSNYPGSQKLIDARRKMKDGDGARMAMEAAQQVWRGQHNPPAVNHPDSVALKHRPGNNILHPRHPQDRISHPRHLPPQHRAYYGRPPHHPFGYSPAGMPPHGSYPDPRRRHPASFPLPPSTSTNQATHAGAIADSVPSSALKRPSVSGTETPKNLSSSKKLKTSPLQSTTTGEALFGPKVPNVPRKIAVEIISFLGSEEVQEASLVSKSWKSLTHDAVLLQMPQPKV